MTFQQKLEAAMQKNNSLLCVGLDSDWEKLPELVQKEEYPQFVFNKAVIDATHDLVCAYKPNSALYESRGAEGICDLKLTCDYLHQTYPEIPIIIDAKRADIGSSNKGYVSYAFEYLQADAITLHPYLGQEAIQPFLDRIDKGCIILCRTSNAGAKEFQDMLVTSVIPSEVEETSAAYIRARSFATAQGDKSPQKPFYVHVAERVVSQWNKNNNCLLVVGATYPEELAQVRKLVGDMTLLVPGIGAQGADVEKTVKAGLNSQKMGMIINASRSVIFASNGNDFAQAARREAEKLRDQINQYRI